MLVQPATVSFVWEQGSHIDPLTAVNRMLGHFPRFETRTSETEVRRSKQIETVPNKLCFGLLWSCLPEANTSSMGHNGSSATRTMHPCCLCLTARLTRDQHSEAAHTTYPCQKRRLHPYCLCLTTRLTHDRHSGAAHTTYPCVCSHASRERARA